MSQSNLELRNFGTADELAAAAARQIVDIIEAKQHAGETPLIALTGGSMGIASLKGLGELAPSTSIEWGNVRFVFGDERFLPFGDSERNDSLLDVHLAPYVELDPANVYRVAEPTASLDVAQAAREYATTLAGLGRIDLVLNGVGPDGHIASLFPGRRELEMLDETTPQALPITGSPKPPSERVTLSLPKICDADRVWLLAAGGSKQEAVQAIMTPDEVDPLPAGRISGRQESLLWVDQDALGACSTA